MRLARSGERESRSFLERREEALTAVFGVERAIRDALMPYLRELGSAGRAARSPSAKSTS
jgi:hypothetical protein